MTGRNSSTHPLTDLQKAILDFLWTSGPATAEAIREGIRRQHPLKDSSIRTLLRRLEARGFISHTVEGKVFVYSAGVPSQQVAVSAIRQVIQRFCAGSVEQLLVGMVDENVLTAADLERLAKKVRKRK
ncbi:MAG TPA: BlaI/MecI/CopY family transcriptional regulator [Vicinamibacterales bacterium]|nr:BlaI/MecI/CopY family transcriptional regulator [Vicinamibacterales bacterium]